MLILTAALASMVVASVGLDVLASRRVVHLRSRPAPRVVHAAGMIALLRGADAELRQRVLRRGSDAAVTMRIVAGTPAATSADLPAPHLEAELRRLVGDRAGEISAFTDAAVATPPEKRQLYGDGRVAKVIAPLGDGQTLLMQWADPSPAASFAVLGLPPSVLAGVLGLAVAGLAVFTTLRETRPLRRLRASVSAFDGTAPGERVVAGGAPDLRALAQAVHDMQARVAALMAERSFLIGAISHDLKTYLTRLRLRVEALPEGTPHGRMVADIEAMTELVETSLAFARGTATSGSRTRLDLGDLAATEVEERNALGPPLRLEGRYGDGAVVVGDPVALRRVLCNILDNAMKFGRGEVTVEVARTPDGARVIVADDGPGIPEGQRDRVFNPYARLEHSRSRQTGGSGLGLAIARQIVETHGGTIAIAQSRAGGAAIEIVIPAEPAAGRLQDARARHLAGADGRSAPPPECDPPGNKSLRTGVATQRPCKKGP